MNKTDIELYFEYKCWKGLEKRGFSHLEQYKKQLKYEIEVITSMKFCEYFLIVADFINWAKENKIPVGFSRGSVGGCLISYCLQITQIDPIKYNLYFERFLNPGRTESYPDIDVDICEENRDKVVEYVKNKYGKDKISNIGTFGTMLAKAAVRDVARTLGYDYSLGDKIAKLILEPVAGKPQPLSICYEKVPELKKYREGSNCPEKEVLFWAEQLENRIKSQGCHASAVIIAKDSINKTIPLYKNRDNQPTTQFEMKNVEECGLVKFDFLGLRTLTTIKKCLDLIKKEYDIDIDIYNLPDNDQRTFKLLQSGDTEGLFQVDGQGIRDLLTKIIPKNIEDISLVLALFRPGPLGSLNINKLISIRNNIEDAEYLFPELKPILEKTGGILIFQEQVLTICKDLAGYSLAEADNFRKILGKKLTDKMKLEKEKFISGMLKNNIEKEDAIKLFTDIEYFSDYSFNAAHSVGYAHITYTTAYLKAHYPLEFICACLITNSDDPDKIIKHISYCRSKGNINILGPSINSSEYNFTIDSNNKSIRFGLGAIKNLGQPVKDIIKERDKNGKFNDLIDFCNRVDLSKINKRKIQSLILAGAFDECGYLNRMSMISQFNNIIKNKDEIKRYKTKLETYNKKLEVYKERERLIQEWELLTKKERKGKKKPIKIKVPEKPELTEIIEPKLINEIPVSEKLSNERELVGYYLSGHPLDNIEIEKDVITIEKLFEDISNLKINKFKEIKILAIPSLIKKLTTKKDKKIMAYATLEDKTGRIEATIFPKVFLNCGQYLDENIPATYEARLEIIEADDNKLIKLMIKDIIPVKNKTERIELFIPIDKAKKVCQYIRDNPGENYLANIKIISDNNIYKLGDIKTSLNSVEISNYL